MFILFFAQLRETVGTERLDLEAPYPATVAALREQLIRKGDPWAQALSDSKLLVAVNQAMAHADTPLKAGDEVAFFPPVTGG